MAVALSAKTVTVHLLFEVMNTAAEFSSIKRKSHIRDGTSQYPDPVRFAMLSVKRIGENTYGSVMPLPDLSILQGPSFSAWINNERRNDCSSVTVISSSTVRLMLGLWSSMTGGMLMSQQITDNNRIITKHVLMAKQSTWKIKCLNRLFFILLLL